VAAPSYLSQQTYEPTGAFEPRPGAARFDPGWTAPPALAGLDAALDLAPEGRFERAAELTGRCRERLAERFEVVTAPAQATLVTFAVDGDTAEVVEALYAARVIVRDVPGLGWLRASCGWWTTDEDVDRLLGALP
jgi:L-cysteine/cystine lyase